MTADVRDVATFNGLDAERARDLLLTCLAVPRWAAEVVAGRPYADAHQLEVAMREAAVTMGEQELSGALARHPRIGERADAVRHEQAHSEREQSGIDRADEAVANQLREANQAYETRFGRVFIIRAAGRSGPEVLDQLRRRLGHTDEQERTETIEQLVQIALLRAEETLT